MPARILIVEDDLSSRELMADLLQAAGHAVSSANDGEAGLRLAREGHPDLVVCAVVLPAMDGYAVAHALKADAACAHIPLLAASALAPDGDRARLLAAGFDGYICKPIEPASFVAEVEAFLPIVEQAPAAPSPALVTVCPDACSR